MYGERESTQHDSLLHQSGFFHSRTHIVDEGIWGTQQQFKRSCINGNLSSRSSRKHRTDIVPNSIIDNNSHFPLAQIRSNGDLLIQHQRLQIPHTGVGYGPENARAHHVFVAVTNELQQFAAREFEVLKISSMPCDSGRVEIKKGNSYAHGRRQQS